jgi:ribonuclease P protein component
LITGITRRSTFDQLRREGTRVRRGSLGLTYLPLGGARPQVAFAISTRVGTAVVRNRSRRRVRAALCRRHAAGELAAGAYLVHIRAPLHDQPAAAVVADVDAVLAALAERLA